MHVHAAWQTWTPDTEDLPPRKSCPWVPRRARGGPFKRGPHWPKTRLCTCRPRLDAAPQGPRRRFSRRSTSRPTGSPHNAFQVANSNTEPPRPPQRRPPGACFSTPTSPRGSEPHIFFNIRVAHVETSPTTPISARSGQK